MELKSENVATGGKVTRMWLTGVGDILGLNWRIWGTVNREMIKLYKMHQFVPWEFVEW